MSAHELGLTWAASEDLLQSQILVGPRTTVKGTFLLHVVRAYSHLTGTLFDLPSVIDQAHPYPSTNRVKTARSRSNGSAEFVSL